MANGAWEIQEIGTGYGAIHIAVPATDSIQPQPGQYFLAFAAGMEEVLATPLFFAGGDTSHWLLAGQIPLTWQPGTRLAWRGPLGSGFHLPPSARRVALAAWDTPPASLPVLVTQALAQRASVVWYSQALPDGLPASVEVLPPESLADAWEWADYLALECNHANLTQLAAALRISRAERLNCDAEILLHTPLTCGGLADCGVCAVRGRKGWKLACKDGPVFDLAQLELAE